MNPRDADDAARVKKMLLRRPVMPQEPPKLPGEYVDELRDEIGLEALVEGQTKHERSQQLWESK